MVGEGNQCCRIAGVERQRSDTWEFVRQGGAHEERGIGEGAAPGGEVREVERGKGREAREGEGRIGDCKGVPSERERGAGSSLQIPPPATHQSGGVASTGGLDEGEDLLEERLREVVEVDLGRNLSNFRGHFGKLGFVRRGEE